MPLPGKERLRFRTDPDRDSELTEYFEDNKLLTREAKGAVYDAVEAKKTGGSKSELSLNVKTQKNLLEIGVLVKTADEAGNPMIDVNPEVGQSGG